MQTVSPYIYHPDTPQTHTHTHTDRIAPELLNKTETMVAGIGMRSIKQIRFFFSLFWFHSSPQLLPRHVDWEFLQGTARPLIGTRVSGRET